MKEHPDCPTCNCIESYESSYIVEFIIRKPLGAIHPSPTELAIQLAETLPREWRWGDHEDEWGVVDILPIGFAPSARREHSVDMTLRANVI